MPDALRLCLINNRWRRRLWCCVGGGILMLVAGRSRQFIAEEAARPEMSCGIPVCDSAGWKAIRFVSDLFKKFVTRIPGQSNQGPPFECRLITGLPFLRFGRNMTFLRCHSACGKQWWCAGLDDASIHLEPKKLATNTATTTSTGRRPEEQQQRQQ